jgi:hypothetical protein
MTKKSSHLLFVFIFLIVCSVGKIASAETFNYSSGYLESDSVRSASMTLSISGQTVTGNLSMNSVCQSNARLPGTEFRLNGNVSGQWEGSGSISGTWTGSVSWCGSSEERSGSFSISSGKGSVIFSSNGSYYNRYIFTPTGKISSSGSPSGSSGSGSPSSWERPKIIYESPSYASFGPPRTGFQDGIPSEFRTNIMGTTEMSLKETRLFSLPMGGWKNSADRTPLSNTSDCETAQYYTEPQNTLNNEGTVGDGINVKAIGEGIGRVWGRRICNDCIQESGIRGRCSLMGIWIVVVGEKGYEEYTGKKKNAPLSGTGPVSDIRKASLGGRVVMVRTKKPVGDAQISLISAQGGALYRDNWKSNSNGAFSIQADNMLITGLYEVMAQKRSADMGTTADPSTVHKDLWPIKKYFVSITKDLAEKGNIDVGDIEMDTVLNIFGGWDPDNPDRITEGSGRDVSENRTPVTKNSPSKPAPSDTKPASSPSASAPSSASSGYNPLGDPNLKNPTSKTPINTAAIDKLGNDFQDGSNKTKKPDQTSQQSPISQPDSYKGGMKTPSEAGSTNVLPSGNSQYSGTQTGGGYNKGSGAQGWSSSQACDESQRRSAYLAGFECGKKAKQNKGTMTKNCSSAVQTYRNIDSKSGWGTCLSGAFDEGYREGLAQISGTQPSSNPKKPTKITAELENKAGENVHIFVAGQDNFGPQNKLTPGQKRTITLNISAGQSVTFTSGRNGQVLAQCSWTASSGSSNATAYVKFSGTNTLSCTTK